MWAASAPAPGGLASRCSVSRKAARRTEHGVDATLCSADIAEREEDGEHHEAGRLPLSAMWLAHAARSSSHTPRLLPPPPCPLATHHASQKGERQHLVAVLQHPQQRPPRLPVQQHLLTQNSGAADPAAPSESSQGLAQHQRGGGREAHGAHQQCLRARYTSVCISEGDGTATLSPSQETEELLLSSAYGLRLLRTQAESSKPPSYQETNE